MGSEVFGLSASLVGLYFGTAAVGYFFGSYVSGRYSMRVGINGMVLWGSILSATGPLLTLLLFLLGFKTALVFFGLMTIVGIGNGMVLPNATSGMLSVRPHLAGTASGLGRRDHHRGRRRALGAGGRASDRRKRGLSPDPDHAGHVTAGGGRHNSTRCSGSAG